MDIIVAASTPDTVNPVSHQAELNGTPCITTDCTWQAYFFGRGGAPDTGFESTYHFFWALEDVIGAFLDLWGKSGVGKTVAGLFPNDADGNAWGDAELGLPKPLAAAGYTLTDPGRYQPLSYDFSAQSLADKIIHLTDQEIDGFKSNSNLAAQTHNAEKNKSIMLGIIANLLQ